PLRARGQAPIQGTITLRKRLMLIAGPLFVVAVAASVAVAAPSDAGRAPGPRPDKLHAERPIAPPDGGQGPSILAQIQGGSHDIQEYFDAVTAGLVREYVDSVVVREYVDSVIASQQAAAAAAQAAAPRQVSSTVYSNSYPGDFLSCVRQRES